MRTAHLAGSLFFGAAILALIACSASNDETRIGTGGAGKAGSAGGGWGGSQAGMGGSMFIDGGVGDGDLTGDSSCATVEVQAEAVPLDIYFMLDRSASMTENYGGTMSIKALRDGVASFLNDPASAGI